MSIILDGTRASAYLKANYRSFPAGHCLHYVQVAYGNYHSIGVHAGQYPYAISAWNFAAVKHVGDKRPPAGFPVFFGASTTRHDAAAPDGDVCISLGGGLIACPDGGGVTTIDARAAAIQRPYLGWTEDFLGYAVKGSTLLGRIAVAVAPKAVATKATPSRPVLKQGASGESVKTLQAALNKHGAKLKVDGVFGAGTATAVKAFQKAAKLAVDGIVGPQTWAKLG